MKISECLWIDKFVDKIKREKDMGKNKSKHFNTYEEAAEWFNSHDMADFEDQLLVNQMLKERLRELR